jgi:hypothetical protein
MKRSYDSSVVNKKINTTPTNNAIDDSISIIDLQKKASDIIKSSKPLIISVDLDFTLW